MPYTVTIKSDLVDVVLTNGVRYQGGDTAILSDDQYNRLSPSIRSSVLSSAAPVSSATSSDDTLVLTWMGDM